MDFEMQVCPMCGERSVESLTRCPGCSEILGEKAANSRKRPSKGPPKGCFLLIGLANVLVLSSLVLLYCYAWTGLMDPAIQGQARLVARLESMAEEPIVWAAAIAFICSLVVMIRSVVRTQE